MPPGFLRQCIPFVDIQDCHCFLSEHCKSWSTEYNHVCELDLNARLLWEKERIEELEQIKQYANKCPYWHAAHLQQVVIEHEAEISQRKERVVEIIIKLGWGYELLQTPADSLPQNRSDIHMICQNELSAQDLSNY
ncbi:hypothetical protein BJ165DRAFT_350570 [Panaeolus papilionaceus]|nr:hypothetical protein BJ165DRAFT_350570 [Panaeolus papilionaceus]